MRPAEPTDTQAVGDIFLAALAGMTYLPELYTEEETRTFIRDVLLPYNEVWVAKDDGRAIGFVGLADGSGNEEGEPEAFYEWRPGEPFSSASSVNP